ncbi:hypothetical protein ACMHYB_01175 [Sorangium sp. So ce1128]
MAPPGAPQAGYPMAGAGPQGGQRNMGLVAGGGVMLFIALAVGALFLYNLYQYLTVEDHFADLPRYARNLGVAIVQQAAMRRMTIFDPISALFGAGGAVLMFLGFRKK